MSEHKNLAEALAAFQGEVPTLHKQAEANAGSFSYKYVDLADIVAVIQPLMLEHGLSWSAFPSIGPDGKPALRYALRHTSGDVESDVMSLMLAKGDAQAHGSAITYARRYALCAVLNIVADKDDDGAAAKAAAERSRAQNGSPEPTAAPAQQTERSASAAQRGLLNGKAAEAKLTAEQYGNAILRAAGQEPRHFDDSDQAQQFVNRQLDRLPSRLVDKVIEEMGFEKNDDKWVLRVSA